jgi:hypothetical protein
MYASYSIMKRPVKCSAFQTCPTQIKLGKNTYRTVAGEKYSSTYAQCSHFSSSMSSPGPPVTSTETRLLGRYQVHQLSQHASFVRYSQSRN